MLLAKDIIRILFLVREVDFCTPFVGDASFKLARRLIASFPMMKALSSYCTDRFCPQLRSISAVTFIQSAEGIS